MAKRLGFRTLQVMTMIFLVFGMIGSSVSAADITQHAGKVTPQQLPVIKAGVIADNSQSDNDFDVINPTKEEGISVELPFSARSAYDVSGSVMNYSDDLIDTDADDLWFFSVESDRAMLLKLLSTNVDYLAQLYIVDWTTGQASPTNVGVYAGSQITLKELPVGDYLIRVYSAGTVGEGYTLQMNAANPSNHSSILSASSTLNNVVAAYPNGDIYANGVFVANTLNANANLEWQRDYYFSWGNGYNSRTQHIYNVKVKSVSRPVSYSSSYASSSNAILIYLDQGTSFMHHASYYQSGPEHVYESTFEDISGRLTPRYLDQEDFDNWGDHILVYDLNTGKAIDFYSVLNYYYGGGIEAAPVVNFLN